MSYTKTIVTAEKVAEVLGIKSKPEQERKKRKAGGIATTDVVDLTLIGYRLSLVSSSIGFELSTFWF